MEVAINWSTAIRRRPRRPRTCFNPHTHPTPPPPPPLFGAFNAVLPLALLRAAARALPLPPRDFDHPAVNPAALAWRTDAGACPIPGPLLARARAGEKRRQGIGDGAADWSDHSAAYFVNSRGQRIFAQQWLPRDSQPPKGMIFMVHGLNGHSSRYSPVAKRFVDAGYAVFAHDFHGHGRSEGFRAYTPSIQYYVDDAKHFVNHVDKKMQKAPQDGRPLPRFLLGHSLGGAVAIRLARDGLAGDPVWNGVMLSAPAVRVYPKPLLKLFAPVIATLAPLMQVQKLRGRRNFGANVEVDPLVVKKAVRARVGYEILRTCEDVMDKASAFHIPLFMAHSKQDRVTSAKGSQEFHRRVASNDKELHIYDGGSHDILGVPGRREKVADDMLVWANSRLHSRRRRWFTGLSS